MWWLKYKDVILTRSVVHIQRNGIAQDLTFTEVFGKQAFILHDSVLEVTLLNWPKGLMI